MFRHSPSLPVWERGLKQLIAQADKNLTKSLPVWERGLKQYLIFTYNSDNRSLPVWERGLKPPCYTRRFGLLRRSPCGSVD